MIETRAATIRRSDITVYVRLVPSVYGKIKERKSNRNFISGNFRARIDSEDNTARLMSIGRCVRGGQEAAQPHPGGQAAYSWDLSAYLTVLLPVV